ncbi:MAG TPA: branched-chain-amino-acid transaminase [Gemmatimonadales bacterium]|nr:branched-chain-amino-acid transaminase [Gemmatimonadales bacterium]
MATIWLDGNWLDSSEARISVFDHGFLYGDGVFEGMRVYGGEVFRLDEHLGRLYDSAQAIRLAIPLPIEEMAAVTREGVRRAGLTDGYLRHVVTRGVGDLGFDPRKCPKPTVLIIFDAIRLWPQEYYERGLRVVTASTPIPHREALSPRVKSLNYLPHVLAKLEGVEAGADEVLMLDSAGSVAEGSGQNLFVVKRGVIRTPPAWAGILRGVTRDVIIELSRDAAYDLREEPINRFDVYTADEAFFTGTAAEIVFIAQVDGRIVGDGKAGPVTRDLTDRFQRLVRG